MFSLRPVAKHIGRMMGKEIKRAPDCKAPDEGKSLGGAMAEGAVTTLENTHF